MRRTVILSKRDILNNNMGLKRCVSILPISALIATGTIVGIPNKIGLDSMGPFTEDTADSESTPQHGSSWDIMINEVKFDGPGEYWVELYNLEFGPALPINISSWYLGDLDGAPIVPFAPGESIILSPSDFAVVHFSSGENETDNTCDINGNGYIDLYGGDIITFESDDQLILYNPIGGMYDAVCWADQDGTYDGTDAQDDVSELASKVQWNSWFPYFEWDNVETGAGSLHEPGETIGRDTYSLDSNSLNDWMEWLAGPGMITPLGGKDAWSMTKGNMNFGATTKISISIIGNDIRLDWEPSPADDVTGYRIYESNTINGFDFGTFSATGGNTWTLTSHAIDGLGHYYIIRAVDSSGNISANSTIMGKHADNLESGWNMISIPFEPQNKLLPNGGLAMANFILGHGLGNGGQFKFI